MVKTRNLLVKLQLECGVVVESVFCRVQRKRICKTANKKSAGRAQALPRGRGAVSSQKLEIVKPARHSSSSKAICMRYTRYTRGGHGSDLTPIVTICTGRLKAHSRCSMIVRSSCLFDSMVVKQKTVWSKIHYSWD